MANFIEVIDQRTKMGCLVNVSNILFITFSEEQKLTEIKLISGESIYVDNNFHDMLDLVSES